MAHKTDQAPDPHHIVRKRGETDRSFIRRLKVALDGCRAERDDADQRLRFAIERWSKEAAGRTAERRAFERKHDLTQKWSA